ncbi:hypothetical protein I4F81_005654 [Pyropia yezoensis]|uniref:Uncharacterized protein n=1 Tax=Pyropia yezoensis TaxID=2788 RepID=A0ACC3C008_PYRYE|nr:hypothetical protein I4F81_005654 [Neopyropia yezoensis]
MPRRKATIPAVIGAVLTAGLVIGLGVFFGTRNKGHTHYSDPATGEIGKLVSYEWKAKATGKVLLKEVEGVVKLPVGDNVITLTVVDSTGDVHSDDTVVHVRQTLQAGAYCNSYAVGADAKAGTAPLTWGLSPAKEGVTPVGGARVGALDFSNGLPAGLAPPDDVDATVVHCVSTLTAGTTGGKVSFSATADGPVALFANGVSSPMGETATVEVNLAPGAAATMELLYSLSGDAAGKVVVKATGDAALTFDMAKLTPALINATLTESQPAGGGQLTLNGAGLFDHDLKILFGNVVSKITEIDPLGRVVQVKVPAGFSGPAPITAVVGGVKSNALPFKYTASAAAPVVFKGDVLKKAGGGKVTFKQPTSMAIGPDGRLYVGRRVGIVSVFSVNSDLAVTATCESVPLGNSREILGVAFNPAQKAPILYVSSSILDWKKKKLPNTAWANGEVVTLVPTGGNYNGGKCLKKGKTIVSGLPVSAHDHGINDLVFLNDGNLLISVGGQTNAGIPAEKLGFVGASPLSGAIVHAAITKPNFNGAIKYDQMKDESKARKVSGDVRIYAAGTRNSFGMVLHTNGHVYATDNGPSDGYGGRSLSCTQMSQAGQKDIDKLLDIVDGKFYGHPNRNRGRDSPIQCKHFPTTSGPAPGYTQPMTTFPTSTDGLVEWTLNLFPSLRGNLLASKFAPSFNGQVFRLQLTPDGKGIVGGNKHESFHPQSGVRIALHPSGVVAMPRVIVGDVLLMRPTFKPPTNAPFVSGVNPARGGKGGGFPMTVYGWGLSTTTAVTVGGKPCTALRDVKQDGRAVTCTTPAGTPGSAVGVVVTTPQGTSASSGQEYRYMTV